MILELNGGIEMKIDSSQKEQLLHKAKHDFKQRLKADTWGINENGRLTIARFNGMISSDGFFMRALGLGEEFSDLADYYNPDYWEEEYDPDTASYKQVRKETAGAGND